MRVLVGCEFSGRVRDAFIARGHDAWSCDLIPSESIGPHLTCDVMSVINDGWDLAIFHPPCTYLCVSGARWWSGKLSEQTHAIEFVMKLANAKIPRIAIENPIGILSRVWRKPDQIIHPWMFGEHEEKSTCLWLKNLTPLVPDTRVRLKQTRESVHRAVPGIDRWKIRSRTFSSIAKAFAEHWG